MTEASTPAQEILSAAGDWLKAVHPKHEKLSSTLKQMLENLLATKEIEILSVSARTKPIEAVLEKISRKNYTDPKKQLTDISGVRVVTYFNSQVEQICKLVEEEFSVDQSNSLDKSTELGTDRLGYRSVHFVCELSATRLALTEYLEFADLKFELQVRTVLQHAWAELAHDRNYKFEAKLPKSIERKLNLYAGMLEIADGGFDSLAHEIDEYAADVQKKTGEGNLAIELNSVSAAEYIRRRLDEMGVVLKNSRKDTFVPPTTIREMKRFGINTIEDLDKRFTPEFVDAVRKHSEERFTTTGIARLACACEDIDRFVRECLDQKVAGITPAAVGVLEEKYGAERVAAVLKERGLISRRKIETPD